MSNVCCKEFSGWFKSFTKAERALVVLEAILLVVLIVLLVLLILHLLVCSTHDDQMADIPNTSTHSDEGQAYTTKSASDHTTEDGLTIFTDYKPANDSESLETTISGVYSNNSSHADSESDDKGKNATEPGVHCSWTPSAKTTVAVHYYEDGATEHLPTQSHTAKPNVTSHIDAHLLNATIDVYKLLTTATTLGFNYLDELQEADQSDGEDADGKHQSYVVALVKLKPPKDVIFGCILTIVAEYWTLTAASCIEAIEEVDSLDSFVIMEQYGSNKKGPLQTIEDIQIHPLYEGKNRSYDLAALKSGGSLIKAQDATVQLPSLLDYALITIGERFTILGYGAYRSIDKSRSGRRLRQAGAYRMPARQCGAAGGDAALRHLVPGRAVPGALPACGNAALCCGAVFSRGLPCNYCSGTPLLRGAVLLGVMADNALCGVACEPQIYVNVAALADWIRTTISSDDDTTK